MFVPPESPGNWPEDFHLENGCYQRICMYCGNLFYGYKRRIVCKTCSENPPKVVAINRCTCTVDKPNDHQTIESKLLKFPDGTYSRLL